jgi:hypothetical protein
MDFSNRQSLLPKPTTKQPQRGSSHLIEMQDVAKFVAAPSRFAGSFAVVCAILFLCLGGVPAHAGATLLLEEPYSYDGTFAGTGHSAVYLSNVCSASPVKLRICAAGESGVVLSRYDGISGYDWIAIPLIPYLYAVDREEAVPLFADAKLVAFLRDQYRRENLEALVPDRSDGGTPTGNWYEMVGASYDRTIYGFEIETTPEQDAQLIVKFNSQPNVERYNFVKRNCADFVREVIDFYYPRAVHRSLIGDLGVTTPKQIAKMLAKYGHHHPELESSNFLVPQVPGAVGRSKPIHGVLESVMAAKKYMVPVVVLHPYIGGGLLAEHFLHKGFDPGRNALILDSNGELDVPMTREQRITYQSRLDELNLTRSASDTLATANLNQRILNPANWSPGKRKEVKTWEHLQAGAQPALDTARQPVLQMGVADDIDSDLTKVGLSRANILSGSDSPEFAAGLLEARLRQELRPSTTRKTSRTDVEKDLRLFQQILSLQPKEIAEPSFADGSR